MPRHLRRSRLSIALIAVPLLACLGLMSGCEDRVEPMEPQQKKVVVLGFDGMSPNLLNQWIEEKDEDGNWLMPNMRKLRDTGQYAELGTTNPPESPVAWASFSTGRKPGNHGIFDFLARNTDTYFPEIAGVQREKPKFLFDTIPYAPPKVTTTISGEWFWNELGKNKIGTVAYLVPMTFPIQDAPGSLVIAGLGVPDMRGTQGTFHYFATDLSPEDEGNVEMGGILKRIEPNQDQYQLTFEGPVDLVADDFRHKTVELDVNVLRGERALEITLQDQTQKVKEGEWSDWYEVSFDITPIVKIHGITRFFVVQASDEVQLYGAPIEIRPDKAPIPLNRPKSLAKELIAEFGYYKTRGWAIETAGLQEERLPEGPMLQETWDLMQKRQDISSYLFDSKDWSVFMAVFSASDRIGHLFYRLLDERSPRYDPDLAARYGDAIKESYVRSDRVLGHFMQKIEEKEEDVTLIVMSDHGMHPWNKSFNINTWLVRNGYMFMEGQYSRNYILDDLFGQGDFFEGVDWSRTQAYALGLGQIYINLKGRESQGIVEEADYERVQNEIIEGLKAYVDYEGQRPIIDVYKRDDIYQGVRYDDAPDLQVGFDSGYRVSWQTCLGGIPKDIVEDNPKKWSGDHCSVDWKITAGIILTNNMDLDLNNAFIYDLAPTILDMYGIPAPEIYDGRSLLRK